MSKLRRPTENQVLQRAAALASKRRAAGKGEGRQGGYAPVLESSRLLTEAEAVRVAGALRGLVKTVYWPALRDLAKIHKVHLGLQAADAAAEGEGKAKIAQISGMVVGMFYLIQMAEEAVAAVEPEEESKTPSRVDRLIKRGMGLSEPGGADVF